MLLLPLPLSVLCALWLASLLCRCAVVIDVPVAAVDDVCLDDVCLDDVVVVFCCLPMSSFGLSSIVCVAVDIMLLVDVDTLDVSCRSCRCCCGCGGYC